MKTESPIEARSKRKAESRAYLRSLPPEEKIARLIVLQDQYYSLLVARQENGGKPISEKWKKWYAARPA